MTVTVSMKGQLVIPAAIRKRYHLVPKSKVDVLDLGHAIVIRPMPTGDPFLASRGILKGKVSTQALLKMRREERAREEKAFR
ncbi:MAG TPA: AbrB family transcriptional regulator [Candidatus Omnitrophica bacterium]|nr:AbrB family transcriptional regulator [Candidatus Omnitrophota bacterium]